MGRPRIITAHHTRHTAYPSSDDVIVQRPIRRPIHPAQKIVDRLVRKASHQIHLRIGNIRIRATIREILNRLPQNLLRGTKRIVLAELNVRRPGNLRLRRRRNDLRMITLRHVGQRLHNALHVHHHHIHHARNQRQLLLKHIARHRNPVPHQNLIGRTAHPGDVDPLGPLLLRQLHHLLVLRGHHDHLRKQRLVPVHDHVHLILSQHSKIRPTDHRHRRPEENILKLRGDHRTAPSIGYRTARPLNHQVLVVHIHPHVGTMHNLHDLPVNPPRGHAHLLPDLLPPQRSPLHKMQFAVLPPELGQRRLPHVLRNLPHTSIRYLDPEIQRHLQQLLLILHPVPRRAPVHRLHERLRNRPPVIRMRGGPTRDHPNEIPRRNRLHRRPTHPSPLRPLCFSLRLLRCRQPTRPHTTIFAATSRGPNRTRPHRIRPIKSRIHPIRRRLLQHLHRRSIHTLYRGIICHSLDPPWE